MIEFGWPPSSPRGKFGEIYPEPKIDLSKCGGGRSEDSAMSIFQFEIFRAIASMRIECWPLLTNRLFIRAFSLLPLQIDIYLILIATRRPFDSREMHRQQSKVSLRQSCWVTKELSREEIHLLLIVFYCLHCVEILYRLIDLESRGRCQKCCC